MVNFHSGVSLPEGIWGFPEIWVPTAIILILDWDFPSETIPCYKKGDGYGGFEKKHGGYPHSWMVYKGKSHLDDLEMDDLGIPLF